VKIVTWLQFFSELAVLRITEYSQFAKTEAKWPVLRREHSKSKQLVVILVNSAVRTLTGLCSVMLQFVVQLFCGIVNMSTSKGAIMSHVAARKPLCSLMTSDNSRSSSVVIVIRLQANDRGIVVRKTFYYLRNFLTHLHVPAEYSLGNCIRGADPLQIPCEVFSGRKGRMF
jgi:hypothetical protein